MDIGYFRRLFRYDRWANNETVIALRATNASPKALRWMAHLTGAEYTWLSRVKGEESPLPTWPEMTLLECERYLATLGEEWLVYLNGLIPNGLQTSVIYRNSRGDKFSTAVADILTQALTHSAYHRGQIAVETRAYGQTPAATDFILAIWRGALEE